tara:strand:+ start:8413 stop:8928 length:516 start_codon:yes stop_codon:yes gene_type:complete
MANEIRINSTLLTVVDNDIANQGSADGDYTIKMIDAHAVREFGGKYNTLTAYTDADIARYTGSVVAENGSTDGLDSSGWQEGAGGPTSGVLPTTVHAIAVEYTAELGTAGNVRVAIKQSGETELRMGTLDLGESIVIPIAEGLPLAEVLIGADAYSNGVHEATINVLVVGV